MKPTAAVEVIAARKTYARRKGEPTHALDGLDLTIEQGDVHGLLGPNGAGKSTLVGAIATLLRLDDGSVRVGGRDVRTQAAEVRRAIGLVTQGTALDEALHAEENLVLFGRLHDLDRRSARARADELLALMGLEDATGRPVATFSGGMRRRLDIAAALVRRPELLLLDEPTTGLDPQGRLEVWAAVRALVASGTTVLLTTQYLDEADQLADTISVLRSGRLAAQGTPTQLKRQLGADRVEVHPADPADVVRLAVLLGAEAGAGAASVQVPADPDDPGRTVAEVVRLLDAERIPFSDLALRRPTLDEVFLHLTGGAGGKVTA